MSKSKDDKYLIWNGIVSSELKRTMDDNFMHISEKIADLIFEKYKLYFSQDKSYITIIGKTKIRKRQSTLLNLINKSLKSLSKTLDSDELKSTAKDIIFKVEYSSKCLSNLIIKILE